MSCEDCQRAQNGSLHYYYRWKDGNVRIVGCRTHVGEIMDALNALQRSDGEPKETY